MGSLEEAQAKVRTLERQLDLIAEDHAKTDLIAKARLRQINQLNAELQRVSSEAAALTDAAAQAEARALEEAEQARCDALKFENECQVLTQRAALAQKTAAELKQQLNSLQASLSDARLHSEWQAQRILELEDTSSASQLLKDHNSQLKQLQTEHEVERRRLTQELSAAHDAIQALQRQAFQRGGRKTVVASVSPVADVFEDILEPTLIKADQQQQTVPALSDAIKQDLNLAAVYRAKAAAKQKAAAVLAKSIQARQLQLSLITPVNNNITSTTNQPPYTPFSSPSTRCSICEQKSLTSSGNPSSEEHTPCSVCCSLPACNKTTPSSIGICSGAQPSSDQSSLISAKSGKSVELTAALGKLADLVSGLLNAYQQEERNDGDDYQHHGVSGSTSSTLCSPVVEQH